MRGLLLLAATTLTLSVGELVEIQRLSDAELRVRFGLPQSCDPVVAAMGEGRGAIAVLISCLPGEKRQDARPRSR
jgi:hypothetical protein